ncbi:hypothetical protein SHIRM173S_09003 [Streptomyces hirsutus]
MGVGRSGGRARRRSEASKIPPAEATPTVRVAASADHPGHDQREASVALLRPAT